MIRLKYPGGTGKLRFEDGNEVGPAAIEAGPISGDAGVARMQRLEETIMASAS